MFDEEQPAVRAQNTAHFAKCPAGIGHRAKRPRGYNSIKAGAFKWQRFRRSLQQLDRDACAFNQLCCALKQLRTRIERYNVARRAANRPLTDQGSWNNAYGSAPRIRAAPGGQDPGR